MDSQGSRMRAGSPTQAVRRHGGFVGCILAGFLAVVVAIVAAFVAIRPAEAAYVPTTRAIFNDPYTSAKNNIFNEIVNLADNADPNSVIRISIYMFTNATIRSALQRAIARGVDVRIVHSDNTAGHWTSFLPTRNTDNADASWHVACGAAANSGCLGSGFQHNKFMTVSSVSGVKDVVLISSQNWTSSNYWENAMLVVANSGLYSKFNGYFADLVLRTKKQPDYYHTESGKPVSFNRDGSVAKTGYGTYRNYFYPIASGSTNPIIDMLTRADCTARNLPDGLGYRGRTLIRVAMNTFTQSNIARTLASLDRAGCVVQVIYHISANDGNKTVVDALRCSSVQRWWKVSGDSSVKSVHSKWFAISGQLKSGAKERVVYTGSTNFTGPGVFANDESMLRISDATVYQAYYGNFSTIANTAGWRTGTEPGGTC